MYLYSTASIILVVNDALHRAQFTAHSFARHHTEQMHFKYMYPYYSLCYMLLLPLCVIVCSTKRVHWPLHITRDHGMDDSNK